MKTDIVPLASMDAAVLRQIACSGCLESRDPAYLRSLADTIDAVLESLENVEQEEQEIAEARAPMMNLVGEFKVYFSQNRVAAESE